MKVLARLRRLNIKAKNICLYYGIVKKYTPLEVRRLWRITGLNLYDLADKLFMSPERCKDYLYGKVKGKSHIDFVRKVKELK